MIFKMCRSVLTFTKKTQEKTGVSTMPEPTLWIDLKAGGNDTVALDSFLQLFKAGGLTFSAPTADGSSEENER